MRRLFWLAMGVTVGALVVRKLSRTAEQLTPTGISRSLSESAGRLLDSARAFIDDAREATRAREAELKESTGLDGELGASPEDVRPR